MQPDGEIGSGKRVARVKTALVVAWVFGCLALLTVLRLHSFGEPLERDDAYYAVVGREILFGRWPYADLWANTPPGIHVLYAGAIRLLGYEEWCVKAMGLGFSLLTAVGLFLLAARCTSRYGGCVALLFFALACSDPGLQGNSCNCEVPMNTFTVWAYYFLVLYLHERSPWKAGAAGLLLGLAATVKTVVLAPFLGGVVLLLLIKDGAEPRRRLLHVLVYAVCATLPWALCVGVFAAAGKLGALWDCVFRFNLLYYSGQDWSAMPHSLALGSRALSSTWPLWALALVWLVRAAPWNRGLAQALCATWLLSTLVEIALPGKYWPHYYYLGLPPCVLIAAVVVSEIRWRRDTRTVLLVLVLAAVGIFVGMKQYTDYLRLYPGEMSEAKYLSDIFVEGREMGRRLEERSPADEKLFNWGLETELYFYSKRRPATRYLVNYPMRLSKEPGLMDDLLKQLEEEKPGVIVVSDRMLAPLERFLAKHYVFSGQQKYFALYTRRTPPGAP